MDPQHWASKMVAGTRNFLVDEIDLSRLSELGFQRQACFGVASSPGNQMEPFLSILKE